MPVVSRPGCSERDGAICPVFLAPQSAANFRELVDLLKTGRVTALIGAGLSASLLPTWPALHAEMQRASGLQPARQFDATFAPADFAEFRDAMAADQYLTVLRERFGGVVTDYPDLYRIIDETTGFEQLVTTNYDEFFATVAASNNRRPRIAVYPHFEDLGARYVYLHGRAETAESPSDLVLCEDDYGRAYEGSSRAKYMLQALFGRPGVFIGSSLQDPDLLMLLRQRTRRSAGEEPDPPLFAIVPVRPATDTEGDLAAAAEVMTQRLHRLGVQAICYAWDRSHSQLRAVLRQLQHDAERRPVETVFLDRARQLNRLGKLDTPKPSDIEQVRGIIQGVPELARHFFERSATTPGWYDALKDSLIIPAVVEPRDIGEGKRQIASWAAAPYIARIASQRPDAVAELIQRLDFTENWHVQSVLARLARSLPDELFAQVLPTLATWMDEPNGRLNHVSDDLVPLPDQLLERGNSSLALDIVVELLLPIGGGDARGPLLRVHDYRLPQLRPAIKRLTDEQPQTVYLLLKTRLLQALQVDRGETPMSSSWRAAIEDHEQNITVIDEALHFLLEEARNALLTWVKESPDETSSELADLLKTDVTILRRLALHVLTVHPERIPFIQQPLITEESFNEYELFHEIAVLLLQHFGALDEDSRALVHRLIAEGPARVPQETDEQWSQYRELFRWQWLHIIPPEYWTAEERVWWEHLEESHAPVEHPTFHTWHGPIGIIDPEPETLDEEALRVAWETGGAAHLLGVLRTLPGSWWAVGEMIQNNPVEFLDMAVLLQPEDGERLVTYFSAYERTLNSMGAIADLEWTPLIELMERISADDLTKLPWTSSQMVNLIDRGITSEYNFIPAELLDRARGVTVRILEVLAHPLDTEPDHGGRVEIGDQLNEPAGKAADAFMRCVWQELFLAVDDPLKLPEGVSTRIEEALDRGWGGLEMRHALGEFWHVLERAELGWLSRNTDKLWPRDDSAAAANSRRAFFLGFLDGNSLSRAALESLRPMFADVIEDLRSPHPWYLTEQQLTGPFVQCLAFGWLYDIEQFDFEGLLGDFAGVAPDAMRAALVRELGRLYRLRDDGDGPDVPATEAKRDEYWRRRVEVLKEGLPVSESSEELGAFFAWARASAVNLRGFENRLNVSIDHLPEGRSADDLLELIAARGENEPLPALRLLLRLCDRLLTEQRLYLWGHNKELVAAIEAVCRGARPSHRTMIRELADRLMRGGLADLSAKLQDCGRAR